MKKSISGLASIIFCAMMFVSCGTTKLIDVAGTENYTTSTIKYNPLLKNVEWNNYKLSLGLISEDTVTLDILGMHTSDKVMTQKGTLSKGEAKLYDIKFNNSSNLTEYENIVISSKYRYKKYREVFESKVSSNIKVNGTDLPVFIDDADVIIEDDSIPVTVKAVLSYKENGRTVKTNYKNSAGAEIYVNADRYAVIDYISSPVTVRINSDVEKTLSAEQKEFLDGVILAVYNYDVNFKNSEIHIHTEKGTKGFQFSLF